MLSAPPLDKRSYRLRLARVKARAQLRWYRRVSRNQHIWGRFCDYYNKQPHVGSHFCIYDEWMGGRYRWSYECALHLEDQAFMLYTRLCRVYWD